MNLIIVESPTKAKTLGRFLGKEYAVEATMGHIKDLPKSTLGIIIEKKFTPDYQIVESKLDTIKSIKKSSKGADTIYIATDPDREGEAIAQHVKEILEDSETRVESSKLKRIVFHEITQEAVKDALTHPRDIDDNLVNAQIARRVLDRLVGYKLSPLLWKKVRRGLSAGRVQSVALRLIVEREKDIDAFKPVEYWEIFCDLQRIKETGQLTVQLVKVNDKKEEINNKEKATKIKDDLEKSAFKVVKINKRQVKGNPYPPFTTSTMTQAAARIFGWTSKKTMTTAQRLYEEGLITYHRTDSTNLASSAVEKARGYIKSKYGEKYLPDLPRLYKTKSKVAQEAHEAIRPTDISKEYDLKTGKYAKDGEHLYNLIWKRFLSSQMNSSIYDATTIDVEAKSNVKGKLSKVYLLRASGRIMIFDGWKILYNTNTASGDKDELQELPNVFENEELKLIKVNADQKFTQPPARFSEASLIKELEKLGIGRPSTYAPIISTILYRKYVEKEVGRFKPTPIGVAVNGFLVGNFEKTMDYSFTAKMEDDLDNIAKGEQDWRKMMADFYTPFEVLLKDVEKNAKRVKIETEKLGIKCPKCKDGDQIIRIGRFGRFISCSNFPECDFTAKYVQKAGFKCPECKKGDVIIKTTKNGKKFFGCSRYPKCSWASWRKPQEEEKKTEKPS